MRPRVTALSAADAWRRCLLLQAASVADEYSQHNWARLVANGGLQQLTIPALKVYLKFHCLPVSGNKTQLMERIEERERTAGGAAGGAAAGAL